MNLHEGGDCNQYIEAISNTGKLPGSCGSTDPVTVRGGGLNRDTSAHLSVPGL